MAAVVDPDPSSPARVRELAAASLLGNDAAVFTTLDDALRGSAGYDIAVVACPHDQHQATALRLLQAGIPVWKESSSPCASTTPSTSPLMPGRGCGC